VTNFLQEEEHEDEDEESVDSPQSLPCDDQSAAEINPTEGEKADTPPFLIGEEVSDEVGLSDGKKIFIDDVLETVEWCVEMRCFIFTQNKPFNQGSHTRATKQSSFHSPERVHHRVCRQMGRPCARTFYFHCR